MGINFAYERKKFSERQEKLRKEYEAAGMTKEQIMEMYLFDLHQFNRDIAYKRHTQQLSNLEESDMEEEAQNPLLHKFRDELTVYQHPSEDCKLWWLEEIEDPVLLKNLRQLSIEELDLIERLAFRDFSQKEISEALGKSPAAICLRLKTIRKKLKNSEET